VFSNTFNAIIPSQLTVERMTIAPFSSIEELLLSDFNIYSSAAMRQLMLVRQLRQTFKKSPVAVIVEKIIIFFT
jgi:hypothetical protein